MSFLDGLVVNVALPKMDKDLGLGVAGLQWTVSGYLLTLSSLLLLGGSLGDIYGRRRVYVAGIAVFVLSSVGCGLAPDTQALVVARLIQGVGGALMVPASLAILQAVFAPDDRGAAVGAWTGLSALFTGLGPFVGGVFVTFISWRWAFFINLPLGMVACWAGLEFIPESRDESAGTAKPDLVGALLAALGFGGLTYWAIEGPTQPGWWPLLVGVVAIVLVFTFVFVEGKVKHPMMPLSLFKSREFNWLNICTVLFYGAFVGGITLLAVQLQTGLGYSPLLAGVASLPVNILLITLSRRFGALARTHGPKAFVTTGPVIVGAALWMAQIHPGRHYWTFVLPAIVVWGIGLSMVVAPLTSSVLAAADQRHIGVASALNNAASRVGQSFAISLLPVLAGMSGGKSLGGPKFEHGYEKAMVIAGFVCFVPALIAVVFVDGRAVARGVGGAQESTS